MVARAKGKRQPPADELEAGYETVLHGASGLSPEQLANLLRAIADAMQKNVSSAVDDVATKRNGHRRNGSNGVHSSTPQPLQEDAADDMPISGYDFVIAQGGPMAEVATMLKRGNLTEEERVRMKRLAYEAVVSMPPPIEPPPTDEEIEQMKYERLMRKYGGEIQPEAETEVNAYEQLKAEGGPFAEMIALLEKEQLSDDETQHLRELGYQQAVGLLRDVRPAPSDAEFKRIVNEQREARYNR